MLAEGTQGHLTGAALGHFDLAADDPPQWELGVKEVWEVQKPLDRVIHSMNWPLRMSAKYREFGGSFVYPMGEDKVSIGFVAGLDYRDATFSVHDVLQEFKTHPMIREILEGGKRVAWGAKTIPSGGYWAMPKRFWAPGLCIAGRRRLDVQRHAAQGHPLRDARRHVRRRGDLRGPQEGRHRGPLALRREGARLRDRERTSTRRATSARCSPRASCVGGALANVMEITGGRFPGGRFKTHDDATVDVFIGKRNKRYPKPDGKLTFDKLSSVFATGNATRDDAPNHIRIQENVPLELALMWQYMCPAQVYEVPDEIQDELEERQRVDRTRSSSWTCT